MFIEVNNPKDFIALQGDLDYLVNLAEKWQTKFHPVKIFVITIPKEKITTKHNYTMLRHHLKQANVIPYLG